MDTHFLNSIQSIETGDTVTMSTVTKLAAWSAPYLVT